MKKLAFVFGAVAMMTFASCKKEVTVEADGTDVDTTVVVQDNVAPPPPPTVDTVVVKEEPADGTSINVNSDGVDVDSKKTTVNVSKDGAAIEVKK